MKAVERISIKEIVGRVNHPFHVTLPSHDGEAVNVSARGVYFEVVTDNSNPFPIGMTTRMPIQLTATTNSLDSEETMLNFDGHCSVMRYSMIEKTDTGNRMGVAVSFKDEFNISKGSDRRHKERFNCSFQIALPGHNGTTKNISANGVHFEVVTDNVKAFSPGTIIPLQITAFASTPGLEKRKLILDGEGKIVRSSMKESTDHGDRIGVTVEFTDKLKVTMDKS